MLSIGKEHTDVKLLKIYRLITIIGMLCIISIISFGQIDSARKDELINTSEMPIAKQNEMVEEQLDYKDCKKLDSVQKMRITDLKLDDIVMTTGYYADATTGGAEYRIISNYSGVEDGMHIQLRNGMWAEMMVKDNSVKPSQFGAYGDGKHDDTNPLQQALLSGYEVVCEENAIYLLTKGLMIPSRSILDGNGSTFQINKIKTFFYNEFDLKENNNKGLFYYQFFMPIDYSLMNEEFNWKDVRIAWNVQQDIKHVGTYYIFMPNHVKEFYFNNVQIYVNGNESNNIQPIKFNGSAQKVDLYKCDIRNNTHAYAGGCVWFNVQNGGYPDFKLRDSYLYSEARDEVISMWGRYGENVLVQNTTIEKKNELCYNVDATEKNLPPDVMIVSKASKRNENDSKSDVKHVVTYNNCQFISSGEIINYFFATNSYYAEEMATRFNNCTIQGEFQISLLTAETSSDDVDQITKAETQEEFHRALSVYFSNTDFDVNVPTLTTTHAPNFFITNCHMNLESNIINLTYPDNRLINCWKGVFINNDIQINNAQGIFVNFSDNYNIHLCFCGNKVSLKNCNKGKNILVITKQNYNIEQIMVRHSVEACYKYDINNNVLSYE